MLFYCHCDWYEHGLSIRPLEDLMEERKVVVVGLGIKAIAEKLRDQWVLQVCVQSISCLFFSPSVNIRIIA